ncbi:MAG: hypothetical protein NZ518_00095 [Dehalococcoidia bacterium]|nr:hypothetical protein [Dehalococcoidia bacterium]
MDAPNFGALASARIPMSAYGKRHNNWHHAHVVDVVRMSRLVRDVLTVLIRDAVEVARGVQPDVVHVVSERVLASAGATALVGLSSHIIEALHADDDARAVLLVTLAELLDAVPQASAVVQCYVADMLAAQDAPAAAAAVVALLASVIGAAARASGGMYALLDDAIRALDASGVGVITRIVEMLSAWESIVAPLRIMAAVASHAMLDSAAHGTLAAYAALTSAMWVGIDLDLGGERTRMWSVHAPTMEATQYSGLDVDSMAVIRNRLYAATPDGIVDMMASTPLSMAWRVRTGLLHFGTSLRKRIPDVYIGHTAGGDVVLKVLATRDQGPVAQVSEHWYRLIRRPDGAPQHQRFQIGRGIDGVYFGFELMGEGPFELDVIEWRLLPLERRL